MRVVVDMVDTLCLVGFQGEVGSGRTQAPNLDSTIQACRGKSIRVLGVDGNAHDIVAVAFKDLNALPTLVPIPQLNSHIIGGGQDEWKTWVDSNCTDIVRMRLELGNLFRRVVIVNAYLEII